MLKKLLLTTLLIFSLIGNCYAAIELDYMEYSTDALAQAAYVSSDSAGAYIVDQQFTDLNQILNQLYGETGTNEVLAQSFIPSGAITVRSADIGIKKTATPTDDIIVRIETNSGGNPSGTLVDANATKQIATASLTDGLNEFVFPASFALAASTTYFLVIKRTGARDTSNYWSWWGNNNGYANGARFFRNSGTWNTDTYDFAFKITTTSQASPNLQSYSEATIKSQGSYSLKGVADTSAVNDTLTRTVSPTIDLTGQTSWKFDIYSSRTGSNLKFSIRDSGLTLTENTPNITSANTWQTVTVDISGVSDANKDAIDRIIVTPTNADAANTFYADNMYGTVTTVTPAMQVIYYE